MIKPLVSIVIPCYNESKYIAKAVDSAFQQTCIDKEIIVVDDGSNSSTKMELGKVKDKINLLLTQENKGVSAARNAGICTAKGDYILVLDSDDYFEPQFCNKAVEELKDPEVNMVTSFARWFWNEKDFQIYKPAGGGLQNFLLRSSSLGTMFRKTDWKRIGGYDETMKKGFEDWEFYIRIHRDGGRTAVIPEVLFHYRKRQRSMSSIANENKYELLEYMYLKHSELYKVNFEMFVGHMIYLLKEEEREKIKNIQRIDFKIGKAILRPVRFLKKILKT